MSNDTADFARLFTHDVPMIDTRAPVEFAKGAFPAAVNLPLMSDVERQKVGTCYKQKGQEAAIALGHQLVSGDIKQARIEAWAAFAREHPEGVLYCFRGGLRSRISQEWLRTEGGIDYPRVTGGYKAMRTFLIETLQTTLEDCDFLLLGGMTGTGKTDVLTSLPGAVDLEGHANHRGSSFGKRATPQPSQIGFENALAIDFLKQRHRGVSRFVLEDESHLIGSCAIPPFMYNRMKGLPIVWLEDSLDNRIERTLRDYVTGLCGDFEALHGEEEGRRRFDQVMTANLDAIMRRLGGERHQQIAALLRGALDAQWRGEGVDLHREWIRALLADYYDPMYVYQRSLKADRIVFAGDAAAVKAWVDQR